MRGVFDVRGTAARADFWYYKLEIRADSAQVYNFLSDSNGQVINNTLGSVDSGLFSSGLYWLKLSVVDISGGIAEGATCTIPIFID